MARPTKPMNERKQPVTISLSPTDLVILDNLARVEKKNRSQIISAMLVSKGFKDLGLSAIELHKMPVQNWPNHIKQRHLEKDMMQINKAHVIQKEKMENAIIKTAELFTDIMGWLEWIFYYTRH